VFETVEDLRWKGPRADCSAQCERMKLPELLRRAKAAVERSASN